MTCRDAAGLFSPSCDGELYPVEARQLDGHLDDCASCREALESYRSDLGRMGAALHALADGEIPARPLDRSQASPATAASSWRAAAAVAVAVAASALLTLPSRPSRPGAASAHVMPPHAADCPWRTAAHADIAGLVSYPVVAHDCLGSDFELVEASVRQGASCREDVRLTYRAGSRNLVLEQHRSVDAEACPVAERVFLGQLAACLRRLGSGVALTWSQRDLAFTLAGDLGPGEAVHVAQAISTSVED
jgi:hypothetical protein